jgi:hypothetical protein
MTTPIITRQRRLTSSLPRSRGAFSLVVATEKVVSASVSRILFTTTIYLTRSTRNSRLAAWHGSRLVPYLTLLRKGFAWRRGSRRRPVGSYPTFSPLPVAAWLWGRAAAGGMSLWHCPSRGVWSAVSQINSGTSYPVESGLSSPAPKGKRGRPPPIPSAGYAPQSRKASQMIP